MIETRFSKQNAESRYNCEKISTGTNPVYQYVIAEIKFLTVDKIAYLIVEGHAMLLGDCCKMMSAYVIDWQAQKLKRLPDDQFLTPELGELFPAVSRKSFFVCRARRLWKRPSETLQSDHQYVLQRYVYNERTNTFVLNKMKISRKKYNLMDEPVNIFAREHFDQAGMRCSTFR